MNTAQQSQPDFGVYIHVPFCATRCGYCDFNTYTPTEVESSHQEYLHALQKELRLAAQQPGVAEASTVFICLLYTSDAADDTR